MSLLIESKGCGEDNGAFLGHLSCSAPQLLKQRIQKKEKDYSR